MKIKILTSGSKANSTLIISNETKVLIDVGATSQYIINELQKENISPNEINAIVITHTHSDHIKGLKSFIKKTKAFVYVSEPLVEEIIKLVPVSQIKLIDKTFFIDNLEFNLIKLSHDVDCYGMLIKENKKEVVYITDTGYINKKYIELLNNKDLYIIESNYNEEMLRNGPYPYMLQQRIRSSYGHLSNSDTVDFLNKVIGPKTKLIFLAHISENNNTYDLAYKEVTSGVKFNKKKIIVTHQLEACEMVEI
ncbi:MAG: MBL fold metallo-hydrolase [Bacilli bacterium]|nr:MBL fold metallo-hydrolase [Bacilli bacterium]